MIAESIAENGNMACIDMAKNGAFPLAGAAGFEPANAGTKNRPEVASKAGFAAENPTYPQAEINSLPENCGKLLTRGGRP